MARRKTYIDQFDHDDDLEHLVYQDWACESCTLINQWDDEYCRVCNGFRMHNIHGNASDTELVDIYGNHNLDNDREIRSIVTDSLVAQQGNQCENLDQGYDKCEIRMVLIGRTGSGKSATGNTILGGPFFASEASGSSITKSCIRKEANRNGKRVLVLDTPGLFDTRMSEQQTLKEIAKCVTISCPGPHAFVLVVGIGRFTEEEKKTVEHFIYHFGKDMIRYMLVVFTRRDDIDNEGKTIEDFVNTLPPYLISILEQCGNRYLAFNNGATGQAREDQVNKLFNLINRMVQDNGGSCYTNGMYKKTEAIIQSLISEAHEKQRLESIKKQKAVEDRIGKKYERTLKDMRGKIDQLGLERDDIENKLEKQKQDAEEQNQKITNLEKELEDDREKLKEEKQAEIDKHVNELKKQKKKIEEKKKKSKILTEDLKKANAENKKLEEEKLSAIKAKTNMENMANQKSSDYQIRSEIRDNVENEEGFASKLTKSVAAIAVTAAAGALGGPIGAIAGGLIGGLYAYLKFDSDSD